MTCLTSLSSAKPRGYWRKYAMNAVTLLKRSRVLIVDDEARNIRLPEPLLQAEGHATLAAGNGCELTTNWWRRWHSPSNSTPLTTSAIR